MEQFTLLRNCYIIQKFAIPFIHLCSNKICQLFAYSTDNFLKERFFLNDLTCLLLNRYQQFVNVKCLPALFSYKEFVRICNTEIFAISKEVFCIIYGEYQSFYLSLCIKKASLSQGLRLHGKQLYNHCARRKTKQKSKSNLKKKNNHHKVKYKKKQKLKSLARERESEKKLYKQKYVII